MNIKAEREKRKLTRKEFGIILGVSDRTVESWETGRRNPSQQVIMLIESAILDKGTWV